MKPDILESGIIKRVVFGMTPTRGNDVAGLTLVIDLEVGSTGITFYQKDAVDFIEKYSVRNINDLIGRKVIVKTEQRYGYISFVTLVSKSA